MMNEPPGPIELPEHEARVTAARFDLARLEPAFLDNPFPTYHALRRFAPVKRLPNGGVFVSRYADSALCYRDAAMSSDKRPQFAAKYGEGTPLLRHHTTSLVFNDSPLHTRVRRLLAAAFTPRALKAMEPRVAALVDGLLDRAAQTGAIDLIEDFAFALPVEVVCVMLGIPAANRAHSGAIRSRSSARSSSLCRRTGCAPATRRYASSPLISRCSWPSGATDRPTTRTCWAH